LYDSQRPGLRFVSALVHRRTVVPDIGGPANAYFHCKSRDDWRKDFIEFLHQPHKEEHDTDDEDSDSHDEDSDNPFA